MLELPILASPWPNRDVKITKNMSGKTAVKNADAGLRQKALFT